MTTSSKTETETETDSKEKEIIADVLRGFLLLENAALTGSEQVFVFGVAGRETWATTNVSGAMTVHCHSNFKADILPVAYTGQQKTMNGQKQTTIAKNRWILGHPNGMTPMDMMTSTFPKTENYHETSDYDDNDNTFSEHTPALLDQPVETQEEDTSKLETVQEAVAAANAAADMSRRTWTQARQLMKDVHRSRGYFPVSKGNSMDVDQGKGMSRGTKGRFRTGKGKHRGKSKGKSKGRRPGPCLLCQGPHWARDCPSHHGGKGNRTVSSGKEYKNSSPFRQAYLEGDRRDWITGAGAFAVWFPSLQNFASFDLQGKLILDSGATMSMGGQTSVDFTSRATTPFLFRERSRGRVDECFACSLPALESNFLYSSAERARTCAVGSRCARGSGACRGPRRLLRVFKSFEAGRHG